MDGGGCILLFGKSLTGKTARMLHELRDEKRVILVDPKCAQLTHLKGWEHVWPTMAVKGSKYWFADSLFLDCFRTKDGGLKKTFRVVVHLKFNHAEGLDLICRIVEALGDCVLAVDEMGLFIPPGSAGALPNHITAVAVSGTHKGVRWIGTAQEPNLVHLTVRSNASRMLVYRITSEYCVKCIAHYLGPLADKVTTLPDYVCIDYRDGYEAFIDSSLVGRLKTLPGPRFKRTNLPSENAPAGSVSSEKTDGG